MATVKTASERPVLTREHLIAEAFRQRAEIHGANTPMGRNLMGVTSDLYVRVYRDTGDIVQRLTHLNTALKYARRAGESDTEAEITKLIAHESKAQSTTQSR